MSSASFSGSAELLSRASNTCCTHHVQHMTILISTGYGRERSPGYLLQQRSLEEEEEVEEEEEGGWRRSYIMKHQLITLCTSGQDTHTDSMFFLGCLEDRKHRQDEVIFFILAVFSFL